MLALTFSLFRSCGCCLPTNSALSPSPLALTSFRSGPTAPWAHRLNPAVASFGRWRVPLARCTLRPGCQRWPSVPRSTPCPPSQRLAPFYLEQVRPCTRCGCVGVGVHNTGAGGERWQGGKGLMVCCVCCVLCVYVCTCWNRDHYRLVPDRGDLSWSLHAHVCCGDQGVSSPSTIDVFVRLSLLCGCCFVAAAFPCLERV